MQKANAEAVAGDNSTLTRIMRRLAAIGTSTSTIQTAAYFASFIGLGVTTGSLGPTLPDLAAQTGVRLNTISCLFISRSLGYVFGSRGGKMFDHLAGNTVLGLTLITMAGIMALVPLASAFWLLLILMFALGAAESYLDIGANILLVRTHGRTVAPVLNALHSFFGVGALLSPIALAAVLARGLLGVHVYFVLSLMLLPIGGWLCLLPDPMRKTTVAESGRINGRRRFKFLVALFLFLYVGAEVGFGGWIFTYATALKLNTATMAAYLTSGFWIALTIGRMLAVRLASRVSESSLLFADLAGSLASLTLILLFPSSISALIAGVCGLGLFMASVFPTLLSFANKQFDLTGRMTGSFITGASLGAMLVPLVIGQLFEAVGPRIVILFATGLLLAMFVVMVMLYRSSFRSVS